MPKMDDLYSAAERLTGNMCLGPKATLAINAGSAATVKTTGAINFSLNGVLYAKTALSAEALSAMATADFTNATSEAALAFRQPYGGNGFYTQPISKTAYLVLCINAGGTVKVIQGTYDGQSIVGPHGLSMEGKSRVPDVPDTWVPFGMIKVVTGSATFLPGTDALDKANVTFTFYDLSVLPVGNP